MSLAQIRIVLVEPAGALNVGSIARVMKNMGLQHLTIVNPRCEVLGAEARQMAVHAIDILERAQIAPDLPTALTGCARAIATTARERGLPTALETPKQVLPWLLDSTQPTALIFGREDSGLNNQELNYAQKFLRIPVNSEYTSLNLAQAVGVCAYELHTLDRERQAQGANFPPPATRDIASVDALEGYYQQLESLLLEVGYLYPHTAQSRMQKIRRLYHRAELEPHEVALLRGMLSQIKWALDREALLHLW
jgi:tRNA/rRNA methyltransferase